MVSEKTTRWLKIAIATFFRLAQLVWPGILGIVYGVAFQNRVTNLGIIPITIYSISVLGLLYMLVLVPALHLKVAMATLFIFDVIPFGGSIAFMVHTSGRWQHSGALSLAIPGMVLHAATSIMVIVFAVFPLWNQGGYKVVFRRRKFLYGCIFLNEREQGVGGDDQESGLEFVEYGRGMVSTSTDETTVKNSN